MKLLDNELLKTLEKHPLYSGEGKGNPFDRECIAKFFNPVGNGYWFITEGSKEDDDYILYGYCDLGLGPDCSEWGYVSLNELQSIKLPFGMTIERDLYAKGTVRELIENAGLEYDDIYEDNTEEIENDER